MHNLTVNIWNMPSIKQTNLSVHWLTVDLINSLFPVTIFIVIEAVLGFVGNSLILCVYTKLYLPCNFRCFVLFLAIYDLTGCVTCLPGEIFTEFHWYEYYSDWHCKLKSYFNVFTVWGSAVTLLLLAFDRYRKVCRPLERQIQTSLALKLCGTGMFLSAVVSVPALILWGIQTYVHNIGDVNVTVSICEKSGTYANASYPFIYVVCVYIFPIGFMMVAVSIWNILIARKLFCGVLEIRCNTSWSQGNDDRFIRNESGCSDISRPSLSFGNLRGMFRLKSALFKSAKNQPYSATANSNISISSCEMKEIPKEEKFYITTDFGEEEATVSNTEQNCNYNDPFVTRISNNSYESNASVGGVITVEKRSDGTLFRRKRKTLIMLILTSVFIVTITVYIVLITLIAMNHGILQTISNHEKVVFFFFLRIYFINCVINPILYGLLDPRFRRGLKRLFCSCRTCL